MSDSDAAPAVQTPAKAQKKKASPSKTKKPANHPKYADMIKAAISSLKERGGSSRQAILKYIVANYNVGKDEKVINSHLKMALRAGAKNGSLKQSKGTGASGSFKLGESKAKAAKATKVTKPKAAKTKSPAKKKPQAKKTASAKKPAASKKPKPAKKAAAAKKPKPSKPKKAKSSPKKKAAPKKAAAKKSAAKK